ncbi:hypothetical protein N24_0243 [Corynebacterium suranareeae]|uniref:Secreted protein n=1 Tax=Corynebacterium suranareeae TaxID=2506452 RepID=A0A160PMQ9_9CORY|nr:hypothetical protein [Corynebacterium suranareeae]BAU94505.1 hypothetical protein N24_0243 [Corynebacterium suranareeae]
MRNHILAALSALVLLTTCTPAAASPAEPGLYSIDLGEQQKLTCMLFDEPSTEALIVASCAAGFPVTWKLLDGAHEQAAKLDISRTETGELSVDASKEPLITTMVVPTEITEPTVINGLYVVPGDNEVRFFATDPKVNPVLITPDSYEVVEDSAAKVGAT